MTKAVFCASYSDWKLIKTRSVVQIVFEVPLESADGVYQVLGGMPDFGAERHFAIARLTPEAKEQEPEPVSNPPVRARKSWDEMPPSQQAAIRCHEPAFHRFLQEKYPNPWKLCNLGTDVERAAEIVRWRCDVQSRKDIRPETEPFEKWRSLDKSYRIWMQVPA